MFISKFHSGNEVMYQTKSQSWRLGLVSAGELGWPFLKENDINVGISL